MEGLADPKVGLYHGATSFCTHDRLFHVCVCTKGGIMAMLLGIVCGDSWSAICTCVKGPVKAAMQTPLKYAALHCDRHG